MKTIFCLLSAILTSVAVLNAQTLTSDINPKIGDVYTNHYFETDDINPGEAGTEILWDFSGLVPKDSSQNVNVVGLAVANETTDFQEAEEVIKEGSVYVFIKAGEDSVVNWGNKGNFVVNRVVHTDPQVLIKYPFTLNDSFEDSIKGTTSAEYMNFPASGSHKGKAVVIADGTGDLKLPEKEYKNVLRVKTVINMEYTVKGFGPDITIESDIATYEWYVDTIRHPVFTIIYRNLSHPLKTYNDIYAFSSVDPETVTSKEVPLEPVVSDISLYPNPSSDFINVSYDLNKGGRVKIVLKDSAGKTIQELANEHRHSGSNVHTFDISRINKGSYFLEIDINGHKTMNKITIQ
ncbi:MAG TPA: T9SS type A sorting domain-containing protein [Cytophagaceae bacterium]